MKARARSMVALAAATIVTSACRSYFLTDELSDAGPHLNADADAETAGAPRPRRIYVFGGSSDGITLPDEPLAFHAEILQDGLLGPWQSSPKPPKSMMWHSSAQGRDFVVLLSGIARPEGGNLKLFIGTVVDGAVRDFTSSPDLLPNRIHHGASLIHGDTLYVMGGETGDQQPPSADIWRSTITATTYAPPALFASLPAPVSRMGMAEGAGSVFLVGGITSSFASTASIVRARFAADGSLSKFQTQVSLPSARSYLAAAVHRSALLVVGGQQESDIGNVLTCPLDATGTVGPCSETAALPAPRSRHRALVHEGRLYVVGGRSDDGGRPVYVGDLTDDGGITSWRTTSALPAAAIFTTVMLL